MEKRVFNIENYDKKYTSCIDRRKFWLKGRVQLLVDEYCNVQKSAFYESDCLRILPEKIKN